MLLAIYLKKPRTFKSLVKMNKQNSHKTLKSDTTSAYPQRLYQKQLN